MRLGKRISTVALTIGLMAPAAHGFITFELETPPASTEPEAEGATSAHMERTAQVMQADDLQGFEQRWAQAPERIRDIAKTIADGGVPNSEQMGAIGTDALSSGYHAPALDFTRDDRQVQYLATLLQEAVMAYNLTAAQALLASGVDPNVNHTEALFMAIERRTPSERHFMLFPDFDASLPLVQAMLAAGADPDVQQYGFRHVTPLSLTNTVTNLGAMIALINAGADPWMKPKLADGWEDDSLMETLAFSAGGRASAEILFRVLRATKPPLGPATQVEKVFNELNLVVEEFAMGSGPDSRHTAWRLDQVLQLAGKTLDRTSDTDRIRAKLTDFSYQADGGWYLAENEIHSRYDAPLAVPDRGDQVWGP